MQRSKWTFAPVKIEMSAMPKPLPHVRPRCNVALGRYPPNELVAVNELCEHKGFPATGQRLLTWTIVTCAPLSGLPALSVSGVSCQQVPQAGPAPAPGPTPKRFWDAAAWKRLAEKKPQATVSVLQFPEPLSSPAPYLGREQLLAWGLDLTSEATTIEDLLSERGRVGYASIIWSSGISGLSTGTSRRGEQR